MLLRCSFAHPPALADFDQRVNGPDGGLINAWLAGIALRQRHPGLVAAAMAGELPVLPYRGGVERAIKARDKVGSLHYLAMWQGLRGEDLELKTDAEPVLTCVRTGVPVRYTGDVGQWFAEGVDA